MGDYTKQTWVDDDGSGTVGTPYSATRMGNIEQGIFDATKQASMDHNTAWDGTNATTNDKKRIVWRRSTDGSYLASIEAVDATGNPAGTRLAYLQAQARMDSMANSDQVRAILQAYGTGGANPGRAALVANYMKNGNASVWLEVKKESGVADPSFTAMLLRDDDYSDFERAPFVTTIPTTNLYDGKVISYLPDATNQPGVVWRLKYRAAEAGSFKWYFVGGSPITYNKLASAGFDSITSLNPTYANLPTTGTAGKVTCPVQGDYHVRLMALGDTPADGQQTYLSFKVGATAANDDWAIRWRSGQLQSNAGQFRINNVAAGADLLLQGKATVTGGRVQEIGLTAHPIRVTG